MNGVDMPDPNFPTIPTPDLKSLQDGLAILGTKYDETKTELKKFKLSVDEYKASISVTYFSAGLTGLKVDEKGVTFMGKTLYSWGFDRSKQIDKNAGIKADKALTEAGKANRAVSDFQNKMGALTSTRGKLTTAESKRDLLAAQNRRPNGRKSRRLQEAEAEVARLKAEEQIAKTEAAKAQKLADDSLKRLDKVTTTAEKVVAKNKKIKDAEKEAKEAREKVDRDYDKIAEKLTSMKTSVSALASEL